MLEFTILGHTASWVCGAHENCAIMAPVVVWAKSAIFLGSRVRNEFDVGAFGTPEAGSVGTHQLPGKGPDEPPA